MLQRDDILVAQFLKIGHTSRTQNTILENSFEAIDEVFARVDDDIAAIVIEPIMGNCGSIAASQK